MKLQPAAKKEIFHIAVGTGLCTAVMLAVFGVLALNGLFRFDYTVVLGAVLGAILIQRLQADMLRQVLPLLIICIGLYFLLTPKLGESDRQRRLSALPYALVGGGCVGFYDGFFGPGAGSFYALGFVTLCGFNLAKATAHAKVLNFTSNFGGLLFFILGGKVVWGLGFVMMTGQFIGARLGARMVLSKGQRMIRPMVVVVSVVMSCKLIYDNHGADIHHWLSLHL